MRARDREVLLALYTSRALTTTQIDALLFNGPWPSVTTQKKPTRCQKRLQGLFHHGFVARSEQLQTLTDGRKPLVNMLSCEGWESAAQLLYADAPYEWSDDKMLVSSPFLVHLLATNDVLVSITVAAKKRGWLVKKWLGEHILRGPQLKEVVIIRGPKGGMDKAAVVPDGYFRLVTHADAYNFFVEMDRGTETAEAGQWGRRDWERKILAYLAYYENGKYEQRYKTKDLRVLVVTTGERRLAHLKAVTEAAGGFGWFWFTTIRQVMEGDVLTGPMWQIAGEDGAFPLVPEGTR